MLLLSSAAAAVAAAGRGGRSEDRGGRGGRGTGGRGEVGKRHNRGLEDAWKRERKEKYYVSLTFGTISSFIYQPPVNVDPTALFIVMFSTHGRGDGKGEGGSLVVGRGERRETKRDD